VIIDHLWRPTTACRFSAQEPSQLLTFLIAAPANPGDPNGPIECSLKANWTHSSPWNLPGRYTAAFLIAHFLEAFAKRREQVRIRASRSAGEESDCRRRGMLRPRRQRPSCRRAAKSRRL